MKNNFPSHICITLFLVVFSCYSFAAGKEHNPVLLRADSLMECCADSARTLLESIKHPHELKDADRAFYALLKTQADDKNHIMHTNDSLIQVAVNYYEKHGDKDRKAEAYFYLGSVYRDMGMPLKEIEAFNNVLQTKGKKEDEMTALSCNNLFTLYREQDFFDEALAMAKKAYSIELKTSKQSNIVHFTRNLGIAYQAVGKKDSTLFYCKEALNEAYKTSGNELEGLLYSEIGEIYAEKNLIDSAYYYMSNSVKLLPTASYSFSTLYAIGNTYHQLNKLDSARMYLMLCLDADDIYVRASSRLRLSDIEKRMENFEESLRYNEEYLAIEDSIDINLRREETRTLIDENAKKEWMKELLFSFFKSSGTLLLAILIITFAIIIHWFFKKKKLEKKEEFKQPDSASSFSVNSEVVALSISRDSERFAECLASLKEVFSDTIFEELRRNPKKKIALRREIREVLKVNITNAFSETIHDLSISFPKLQDDDLYCCVLYLLDFESRTVESIMGVENVTLRGRRSRIRKNIEPQVYAYIFGKKQ